MKPESLQKIEQYAAKVRAECPEAIEPFTKFCSRIGERKIDHWTLRDKMHTLKMPGDNYLFTGRDYDIEAAQYVAMQLLQS